MKAINKDINENLVKLFESGDGYLFEPLKKTTQITADDRLTESFNQITEFVEGNDRFPEIESDDMGEASLGSRLEAIKYNKEKVEVLKPVDRLGLLVTLEPPKSIDELFEKDNYRLFSNPGTAVLKIKNVPKKILSKAVSVERRKPTKNFEAFKTGFIEQQNGLKEDRLKLVRYYTVDQLHIGNYYIHDNQMLRIIDVGEKKRVYDRNKERFRIIFENGTESNMYRRSMSQRLYENGYCIVDKDSIDEGQTLHKGDTIKGYVYVLKSKSSDPKISTIRDLYKIGYSTTPVIIRTKDAAFDPTYLMAPVEVVASYIVTNEFNPQKIEYFLHRIFSDAALELKIIAPNGQEYKPLEWYSVPLNIIRVAINLLQSGEIVDYIYDSKSQKIKIIEKK